MSRALIGGFFTSSATGKPHYLPSILIFIKTLFKYFVLLIQKIHAKWILLKFQCKVMEARAHLAQGQTRTEKFEAIWWLYFLFSYTIYLRRRQWHPTPVLLPGKSHRWRSLVGCSPWGCWGSDTTERLHFHFSLSCIGEGNGNPLTFHFHALEKEMATHSNVLAWRIPGTGEPGGLPSMGSHRVGHDWCDLAAAAYHISQSGPFPTKQVFPDSVHHWVSISNLRCVNEWNKCTKRKSKINYCCCCC